MRRLLVLLLILAVVFVVADRVAWYFAERGLASAMQRSEGLSYAPDVTVAGFPLLTQAARGRYDRVEVHLRDVPADDALRLDELETRWHGVRVSLGDLLGGPPARVPVDSATARSRVSFANLNAATAARLPGDRIQVAYGPGTAPDRISLTGEYRTPIGTLRLTGEAQIMLSQGSLRVQLDPDTLTGVPAMFRQQVAALLGIDYQLPAFPFGFKATSVDVTNSGVTVRAEASDVVLESGGAARGQ